MSDLNMEVIEQPASKPPIEIPACQKCGRQDETLRFVAYPFVFSVVFLTFRRALTGLWCKTHRAQNQTLAGLISSIFGWIGFPFGLIFTPFAIFQLAKGGDQPADANIHILTTLAEAKYKSGDTATAVRCLEESLKFRDDPDIKARLNQIRPRYEERKEPAGCLQIGLRLVGAILISTFIGIAIGILDYSNSSIQFLLFGSNEMPVIVAILTWTPLLVSVYFGGLGLSAIIERTLLRIQSKSPGLAICFAIIAALGAVYGILEGNVISDNIYSVLTNQFESVGQIIVVGLLTLFIGGFFWMAVVFPTLGTNIAYIIILLLTAIFFLAIGIWKAGETIRWQQRTNSETPM